MRKADLVAAISEKTGVREGYVYITNKLTKESELEFIAWLRANPSEFELYKNVIYSPQRSRFVESLKQKTNQRLDTMVNQLLKTLPKANNIGFLGGRRRKTRRLNKIKLSRKYR